MKSKIYAAYQGEEILCIGTIKEISKKLNMKESTVTWHGNPAAQKRREKRKTGNLFMIIEIKDDEE